MPGTCEVRVSSSITCEHQHGHMLLFLLLQVAKANGPVDILMGIGGTPEGVIAGMVITPHCWKLRCVTHTDHTASRHRLSPCLCDVSSVLTVWHLIVTDTKLYNDILHILWKSHCFAVVHQVFYSSCPCDPIYGSNMNAKLSYGVGLCETA